MTTSSIFPKNNSVNGVGKLRKILDACIFGLILGAYPLSMLFVGNGQLVILSLLPFLFLLPMIGTIANVRVPVSSVDILLPMLLCYLSFSVLAISHNSQSSKLLIKYIIFYLAAYSIARILLEKNANLHVRLFFPIFIVFWVFLYVYWHYGSVRLAFVNHEVAFGAISNWMPSLVVPFATLIFFSQYRSQGEKWLGIGNMFMFSSIIILSQSRFGYFILATTLFWRFLTFSFFGKLAFLLAGVIFLFIHVDLLDMDLVKLTEPTLRRFASYLPAFQGSFDSDMQNIAETSRSARSIMLSKALEMWVQNPIFGIGLNGMADVPVPEVHNEHATKGIIAHNLYLATGLGELGVVGFLLLTTIVALALIAPLRLFTRSMRIPGERCNMLSIFWSGLAITLVHAWFRPQLDNPVFFAFLIMAGWRFHQHSYTAS